MNRRRVAVAAVGLTALVGAGAAVPMWSGSGAAGITVVGASPAATGSDGQAAILTSFPATTTTTTAVADPATVTPTTTAPAQATAPYEVEQETITLVDDTRSTPARGEGAATDGRTLRTLILRPVGVAGPLPLVVFAHGYDSEPEVYLPLLQAWAAAGYLVAAPELPGSARDLPGEPTRSDIGEQARDLSFVVTSLLDGKAGAGAIDAARIAVAGHSDGGSTVATLALNPAYADTRVDAYLVLSGAVPTQVDGPWDNGPATGSLLAVVGEDDEYGNLPATTSVYDRTDLPKALVTVAGGDHLGIYVGTSETAAAVRDATTRFLDAVIGPGGSATNVATLEAAGTTGVLHVTVDPAT